MMEENDTEEGAGTPLLDKSVMWGKQLRWNRASGL
jgi:hypothetical protein